MQQMVLIVKLIVHSTYFGHHYAHHQELKSIVQVVHSANRTHNQQLHTQTNNL